MIALLNVGPYLQKKKTCKATSSYTGLVRHDQGASACFRDRHQENLKYPKGPEGF